MIDYFVLPELPDRTMFRCDQRRATLSTDACSDMWNLAQTKGSPCRVWTCRNCPVGAQHAGFGDISLTPLRGQSICGRCEKHATRLIRGHLCVSCYNREREAVLGKNARGTAPIKHPPLHRLAIRYVADHQVQTLRMERAVSTAELMVAALRDTPRTVTFGYMARRPRMPQGELFE